jgi:DedD protein
MDDRLKHRLVGAAVLVLAAVVFVPMLLDSDEDESLQPAPRFVPSQRLEDTDARVVPLESKPAAVDSAPVLAITPPAQPAPIVKKPVEKPMAKPVSPPTPVAPVAPTVASGFAVQLGSFSKADNAEGLRDKLIAKGYKAFVKNAGGVTRVYVGPQPSRAEAEKQLEKLRADTKLKGIVVKYSN